MDLPVVDVSAFLSGADSKDECVKLAQLLREYGCAVLRDPRVSEDDNNQFLDIVEAYFEQPYDVKIQDARPQLHYQVGCTPDGIECPRDHTERINTKYIDMCRPITPTGPDPKWRYFWRIGERPQSTEFAELNAEPVIPQAFPQWPAVMNKWGNLMLSSVTTAAEMLAVGLDLPRDTFSSRMANAPHLLAPTGSDLGKHNTLGEVLAGFHYDLNFLTIHGKSRFPALNIFLRDGSDAPRKKVAVKVPDGCLLIQAGKELEWLTGGHIQAGYHEVIILESTLEKIAARRASNQSLWRISSTLFSHIASDQVLYPLDPFRSSETESLYPPTKAGKYVNDELATIKLASN
eukprot:c1401_g1_i1.p1 GENE.c1401_g1_i1~~c1401_g1_i1.p1  ORF type:complete len:347 (+),score=67.87 c1401_g1_i1:30-1070(+)